MHILPPLAPIAWFALSAFLTASSPVLAEDWSEIIREDRSSIEARLSAAFEGMAADICFDGTDDTGECPKRRFELDRSHVDPAQQGRESILIIDVLPPTVAMLRYRNRILGMYEVAADHGIEEQSASFELPETLGEIVTGFASPTPVPSEALAPLLPELTRRYGDHSPLRSAHGTAVFGILADLAPGHPLVLLDNNRLTFNQSVPALFCSIPRHPGRIALLRERAHRFADDLRALMEEHNVRYVNASFGYTIETVRGPWRSTCGTAPPSTAILRAILAAYRPIFDALFDTPGVFTAHAALASPNDLDAPYDQLDPAFPNRLRVGSLAHAGTEIPEQGVADVAPGWDPAPADPGDVDLWVNAGCTAFGECRAERTLSMITRFGMGRATLPLPQSSFVTPLALSAFIDLRDRPPFRERSFDNDLIDDLIVALHSGCEDGYCRVFDPLLHGRMERFRNDHAPAPGLAGLWSDPQRRGHGLELQRFGGAHAGLFRTFDEQGHAEWYWLDSERYGGTLYGTFLRFRNLGTSDELQLLASPRGQFSITFEPDALDDACVDIDGASAFFEWSIDESVGQWCLRPEMIRGSQLQSGGSGHWRNSQDDSGWGFGLYSDQDSEVRIVYYYDPDGQPTWAFGKASSGANSIKMYDARGYCRTCTELPLLFEPVGLVTGAIDSTDAAPTDPISVLLDEWMRIAMRPERLSD